MHEKIYGGYLVDGNCKSGAHKLFNSENDQQPEERRPPVVPTASLRSRS
jgi:hypothetical protein